MSLDDIIENMYGDPAYSEARRTRRMSEFERATVELIGTENFEVLKDYLYDDKDYYGYSKYYKCNTVCIRFSCVLQNANLTTSTLHSALLKNKVVLKGIKIPKYSSIRHIDGSSDFNSYTKGQSVSKAHIDIELNGVRFVINCIDSYGSTSICSSTSLINALSLLDSKSEKYKLFVVQEAIHNSRTRVLGSKYSKDLMYTRLV